MTQQAGTQGCSQIKCDSVYKGEINSSYVLSNFLYILLCVFLFVCLFCCVTLHARSSQQEAQSLNHWLTSETLLCAFLTYESSYFLLLESGRVGINK